MQRHECEAGIGWVAYDIPSSDPEKPSYTVCLPPWYDGGFCTCPGFEYRGECRHLQYAQENRCVWKSGESPQQTEDQCRCKECPRCGGPTRMVVYADDE